MENKEEGLSNMIAPWSDGPPGGAWVGPSPVCRRAPRPATEPHRRKAGRSYSSHCPGLILRGPTEKWALLKGRLRASALKGVANVGLEQVPAFLTRWGLGLLARQTLQHQGKTKDPEARCRGWGIHRYGGASVLPSSQGAVQLQFSTGRGHRPMPAGLTPH